MVEDQIQLIPLSKIDRPLDVARDTIDPERVRELAESIREDGLLQPIILRPSNGRFEIVAGDRRFLAHKLLGEKVIKAIVKELDDGQCAIVRGVENLQRVDLTASEEARTYVQLREQGGLGVLEICRRTGKSPQTVKRYMDFWKHPPEVRAAVDQKRISLNTIETLSEIDDPDAFKYFFDMAAANGITDKVARLWVDDYFKTKAGTYYESGGGVPGSDIEIVAKPVFMTCELCHAACEIHKVRSLVACPDCVRKVLAKPHA